MKIRKGEVKKLKKDLFLQQLLQSFDFLGA